MSFAVVDWNVNGFVHRAQAGLLADLEWDVACLQEDTRGTWEEFRALGDAGDVAFSYLPPLAAAGPRYGCVVIVRHGVELVDFGVLRDVPSPERAAVAEVRLDGGRVWVASWAAPPGVTWGSGGKGRQVERFAAWLRERPGPMIVGIDRNVSMTCVTSFETTSVATPRSPPNSRQNARTGPLRSPTPAVESSAGTTRSTPRRSSRSRLRRTGGVKRNPQEVTTLLSLRRSGGAASLTQIIRRSPHDESCL